MLDCAPDFLTMLDLHSVAPPRFLTRTSCLSMYMMLHGVLAMKSAWIPHAPAHRTSPSTLFSPTTSLTEIHNAASQAQDRP